MTNNLSELIELKGRLKPYLGLGSIKSLSDKLDDRIKKLSINIQEHLETLKKTFVGKYYKTGTKDKTVLFEIINIREDNKLDVSYILIDRSKNLITSGMSEGKVDKFYITLNERDKISVGQNLRIIELSKDTYKSVYRTVNSLYDL